MVSRSAFAGSAILGGAIWLLAPAVFSAYHFSQAVRYDYLVLLSPFLLVVGLYGFKREYGPSYSAAGRTGIVLLGAGTLGFVPIATHNTLFTFTLPVGVILFFVGALGAVVAQIGAVGMAFDAWRRGVPAKGLAVWLPLALPATAVSNYLGATVLGLFSVGLDYYTGLSGLAWIGLGYYVWNAEDRDAADVSTA